MDRFRKETRHAPVLGVTLRIAKPLKRVGALYHKPVNGQSRVRSAPGKSLPDFLYVGLEPGSWDVYRLEAF